MTSTDRRMVREEGAARYLDVAVATLRKWRWAGCGPVYHKIGRSVRYHLDDLEAYAAAARRTSTSDRKPSNG